MNKNSFSVDARTILQLGRDSIKNPTTAVVELVKNGYDADATVVNVNIKEDQIKIADNGLGMNIGTIRDNWLRIGYSDKKLHTLSPKHRRKTGEKGIGRISADRLGSKLTLISKTKDSKAVKLTLNWDDFDVDGTDLVQIPIHIEELDQFTDFKIGTEITIKGLRQSWEGADIERLYIELSALVSPFAKTDELQINFSNHILPEYNRAVTTSYDDAAELRIEASYIEGGKFLSYTITDTSEANKKMTSKTIGVNQLTQHSLGSKIDEFACGSADLKILFFSRSSNALKTKGLSPTSLRKFLDINAGIKIYRDNISVKPFGFYKEPGGDWLGLAQRKERDPAGLNRPTYKVSSYQLVGAVSVGRDTNPWLTDGASREGLVENEAFNGLRNLTTSCVYLLEQYRHRQAIEAKKVKQKNQSAVEKAEAIKQEFQDLTTELSGFSASKTLDVTTKQQIERVIEKVEDATDYINDILDENRVFRGLATIGISMAVFGHETQSTISRLKSQVNSAYNALVLKDPVDLDRAIKRLIEASDSASHVAKWGEFALARVRKDKRTRRVTEINKVVIDLLNEISDVFTNSNITVEQDIDKITSRAFAMDIESILLNLLTNAYAFAGNSDTKTVRVELKPQITEGKQGFILQVSDSGPGVEESMVNTIWEPLVSTKKDRFGYDAGTGLGLAIVSSTASELGGDYWVVRDPILKGARFTVWLPTISGDKTK